MTFKALQSALMGPDVLGHFGYGSGQCRDRGNKAIQPGVRGLHLLIGDLLGFSKLRYTCRVLSDQRLVFQLLVVEPAHRRPEFLKAAKGAHCE